MPDDVTILSISKSRIHFFVLFRNWLKAFGGKNKIEENTNWALKWQKAQAYEKSQLVQTDMVRCSWFLGLLLLLGIFVFSLLSARKCADQSLHHLMISIIFLLCLETTRLHQKLMWARADQSLKLSYLDPINKVTIFIQYSYLCNFFLVKRYV